MTLCPVISEFSSFSGIVDFSEGYLSFECGETKPVKVLDVNRSGPPESVILPGIRPKMKIAVSSGACFVLGAGVGGIYLWKRNEAQPTSDTTFILLFCDEVSKHIQLCKCCFSIDSKLAVVSMTYDRDQRNLIVFNVETGVTQRIDDHQSPYDIPFRYFNAPRVFCNNMKLILVTANLITIFDLGSRKHLETSFQRHITEEFVRLSKLSPKGNVLAVPGVTGDMEFIPFNMPEYSPL